jgi:DNA repair exonuclease SbcCD nuclease subunit
MLTRRLDDASRMKEFIAIGDLHLTDSTGKGGLSNYIDNHDEHVADLVINQPLIYAKKNKIKNVVLLGDLCESPRMSYSATKALRRIVKQPFEWHIIPGNHDLFAPDPEVGHSLELLELFDLPNVHIYKTPTNVGDVRFLPWPHQDFDDNKINIAHVDVQGSRTDSGRLNKGEKLSRSKALAIIGHIHTSQRVRNSIYPGTLYQTNFGEPAEKFFAHARNDGGWEVDLVPVKPTYRLHSVQVESRRDLKAIPASKFDLVKLILNKPVDPQHYAHLNVVMVRTPNSASELATSELVSRAAAGSAVEISTNEFFKEWLRAQPVEAELKQRAFKIRKAALQAVAR